MVLSRNINLNLSESPLANAKLWVFSTIWRACNISVFKIASFVDRTNKFFMESHKSGFFPDMSICWFFQFRAVSFLLSLLWYFEWLFNWSTLLLLTSNRSTISWLKICSYTRSPRVVFLRCLLVLPGPRHFLINLNYYYYSPGDRMMQFTEQTTIEMRIQTR